MLYRVILIFRSMHGVNFLGFKVQRSRGGRVSWHGGRRGSSHSTACTIGLERRWREKGKGRGRGGGEGYEISYNTLLSHASFVHTKMVQTQVEMLVKVKVSGNATKET